MEFRVINRNTDEVISTHKYTINNIKECLNNIELKDVENIIVNHNLDYDDAYQLKAAKRDNLEIVTMDQDFTKIATQHKILFI